MTDPPTRRLFVGVGMSSSATAGEVADLVTAVVALAGGSAGDVEAVCTLERFAGDDRLCALGRPVRTWTSAALAAVAVQAAAVAEPAALLGAGDGAALVVAKRRSAHATAAVAAADPAAGRATP